MRRSPLPLLRLAASTAVLAAVVASTLFVGHAAADAVATGLGLAQLIPSLLRWSVFVATGAGTALFVAPLLLLTVFLFGRAYCSSLCPLGTIQDLLMLLFRRHGKVRFRFRPPLSWLRLVSFAAAVGVWLAGSSFLLALLEPYSIFHRSLFSIRELLALAPPALDADQAMDGSGSLVATGSKLGLVAGILSLAILVSVLIAAARKGRVFCNTLCPAGSLLSLPAGSSLLRIRISPDRCTSCGLCERACPARCIDSDHKRVFAGSCILCFECLAACRFEALHYCRGSRES